MNNMIPAVDKAIQLLLHVSLHECTQSELSRELGTSMSTTYRILMTLQAHGWVRKGSGGRYHLNQGAVSLGGGVSAEASMLSRGEELVRRLCQSHGMSCKLSVRYGWHQLTRFRAEPPGPAVLTGEVFSTFPLIEGSVGAALLCEESRESLRLIAAACAEDIPEKGDPGILADRIAEVRRCGTCLNVSQNRWNIAACSVPLRNRQHEVFGALTLLSLAEDFAGERRLFWDDVLLSAARECES